MKVGEQYLTRGGWRALIIWVYERKAEPYGTALGSTSQWHCYAIHQPGTLEESEPVYHTRDGRAVGVPAGYGEPPVYGGHPADLMREVAEDETVG